MIRPIQAVIAIVASVVGFTAFGLAVEALIRFAEPIRLLLLAVPGFMVSSYATYLVWRGRVAARIGHPETVRSMTASWSRRLSLARAGLLVAGATFLVVAIARPQWGEQTRQVTRKGIDVVFALDISRSMLAGDVAPSRLEAAVSEMDRLMRLLDGDRVGLVVFAGISFVQSPLTSDYGALRLYLDRLSPDDLPAQGTAIGRALTEATKLLTGGGGSEGFERAENQLIIVFTDGEDHETDPIAAATEANANGIHVYTVGVGTPDGARIPIRDRDGSIERYLTDRDGQVVVTRLEEDQLIDVAAAGGGRYVRFASEGAAAAVLEESIEEYDAQALSSALRQEYQDRFHFFLFPGLALLLASTLVSDRRRHGALVSGMAVLLALAGPGCADGLMREDPRVERAMETLSEGDAAAALEALERVPAEAEDQPELHYDRGLVYEALEEPRDAQASFVRSLTVDEVDRQVSALVALGNTLFAQELYETAIERYRRALVLDPTHDGARRNLEIAMLRLYPPCSELDDDFEDNDGAGEAASLDSSVYQGEYMPPGVEPPPQDANVEPPSMVACGDDPDWWAIPVVGGATLDIDVEFHRLRDDTGHEPPPESIAPTDVRVALIDVDGESALAVDQGLTEVAESAEVAAAGVTRSLEGIEISPTVDADGVAYLLVEVEGDLEYEYEVEVTLTPPCWALEDGYESNDRRASAAPFEENGPYPARICATNDDWFARSLDPGDSFFIDATPVRRDDGEPGTIDVRYFAGAGGAPAREARLTDAPDTFSLFDVAAPTDVAVSVSSIDETEGNYQLSAYRYGPCPDNDRFEPNDEAGRAHQVDPQQDPPPFRHLRLCEGDNDWFMLPLPGVPEEDRENEEFRPFSALAEVNGSPASVQLAIYDAGTRRRVALSTPVEAAAPESFVGDTPETGAVAYARLPWETEAVYVVAYGEPTFYHLSFPHTEEQQQQQQQQQQQEQDGEQGEEGDQEQESEPQPADSEDESQGAEPEEQEPPEPPEPEEQDQAEPRPTDEEEQRELLMQLLDSLESEDVNLPLQQALEAAPANPMRNEW